MEHISTHLASVPEQIDCCLSAGTVVMTPNGMQPIETITVGDWVQSKSSENGRQADKRVVRIIRAEDKPICRAYFSAKRGTDFVHQELLLTSGHKFFVAGYHNNGGFSEEYWNELEKPLGWHPADALQSHQLVELANGGTMQVGFIERLWATRTPGEAWIEVNPDPDCFNGHRVIVVGGRAIGERRPWVKPDFLGVDDFNFRNESPQLQEKWAFKATVFGLEVEDFHTYYVGEEGIWVKDNA
jgi:hypothetical protein